MLSLKGDHMTEGKISFLVPFNPKKDMPSEVVSEIKKGKKKLKDILLEDKGKKIKKILEFNLRTIESQTVTAISTNIEQLYGREVRYCIMLPLIYNSFSMIHYFEKELDFPSEIVDFLREIVGIYGTDCLRAELYSSRPGDWVYVHSSFLIEDRGPLMKTDLTRGDGSKFSFSGEFDSHLTLVDHILKNINRFVGEFAPSTETIRSIRLNLDELEKRTRKEAEK
jgi:hypothetical protein